MEYGKLLFKTEFKINRLVTLHYYEFAKDFIFKGERHDFWEFLYVDEGEVEVTAEDKGYVLTQGDIIFHKPNEFHSVWTNKKNAPNAVVICFECGSDSMRLFENKIFSLGDEERNLLLKIVREGLACFVPPLNDPEKNVLFRKKKSDFAGEQMIKNYLEIFLITIIRNGKHLSSNSRLSSIAKERSDNIIVQQVSTLIKNNLDRNYSLDDLCNLTKTSKSYLAAIFRQRQGVGVIEFMRKIKIEQAKILIREGNHNITGISQLLGYSSVHYFSRYFTKVTDCTPTEYARSIKARL